MLQIIPKVADGNVYTLLDRVTDERRERDGEIIMNARVKLMVKLVGGVKRRKSETESTNNARSS